MSYIGGFDMAREARRIEQRIDVAIARQPGFEVGELRGLTRQLQRQRLILARASG